MEPTHPISFKTINLPNNETYAYRESGHSSQILLLLHGNFTTSLFFESFIPHVSNSYRVIAPDMRGFGHSSYNKPINSFEDICQDLKYFLEALKISKVIVLGWSLGGPIAQLFTCKYPNLVENLITVGSVGPRGTMLQNTKGRFMKTKEDFMACHAIQGTLKMIESKDEDALRWFLTTAGFQGRNVPPEEKMKRYIEEVKLQRNIVEVFCALNNFNITKDDNGVCEGNNLIEEIKSPCLFIHGNHDANVQTTCSLELKEYVKHAELKIMEGGRHFLFEPPYVEKLVKIVRDFLNKGKKIERQEEQN